MPFEASLHNTLELSIVLPAAVIALIQIRQHIKYLSSSLRISHYILFGGFIVAFCVEGGLLCKITGLRTEKLLLLSLPVFFAVYYLISDTSVIKCLFCFSNAVMIEGFCYMYSIYLVAPIEKNEHPNDFSLSLFYTCLLLSVLVFILFFYILNTIVPFLLTRKEFNSVWFQITPLPVVTSFFFLWSTPISRAAILTQRVRKVSLFLFPLLLLFVWIIYMSFYRITNQIIKNAEVESKNHLLQLQEKRYRELQDYMNATRTLRHDFRQHLLVLEGLSKNGEFSKLSDYLDSIIEKTNVSFDHFATNSAVDAIAAYYDSRLKELNAEIIWKINLPEALPISESDLCSVLGNLLENATHALSDEPEENRSIKIVSGMLSSAMLGISVENNYSGKPISENNRYNPSFKDNYSEHGIGLSSVYATVKKYNGTMDLKVDNGVFSADIIFYSPCQATETAAEIV